jgi:hypothetical protein
MTATLARIYDLSENKWFVFLSGLLSIVGGFLAIRSEFRSIALNSTFAIGLMVLLAATIYSYRVRRQLRAFQDAPRFLHEINHNYRNVLAQALDGGRSYTEQELIQIEQTTVSAVCQKIASIYTGLISRPCVATVKLLDEENGRLVCRIYARSDLNSRRDQDPSLEFSVKTGANTAFDDALKQAAGGISHFFSADLPKLKKAGHYRNQRDDFEKHYHSTIVVPIRFLDSAKAGKADDANNRGFLCIDTLSKNCLNERYHLELLASMADQMYNFFSLMRGEYKFPPQKKENK